MNASLAVFLVGLLSLTACMSQGEDFTELGPPLTRLSKAVESTVRYKSPPTEVEGTALLELSTKHDPALLIPFSGFSLHILRQDPDSVVLVCTEDNSRALFEDAGCTARLEVQHWNIDVDRPCIFTVNPSEICALP